MQKFYENLVSVVVDPVNRHKDHVTVRRSDLLDIMHQYIRGSRHLDEIRTTAEMSASLKLIGVERVRQLDDLGYSPARDHVYTHGELSRAAGTYALGASCPEDERNRFPTGNPPPSWPATWSAQHWKPKDRRTDLVRAGALIVAELDRIAALPDPNAPLSGPGNWTKAGKDREER